ncbi:cell division protein FtsL [Propylenella binzhouense]|uniref:Cell division protein FtsL n=1 Tax=Propylenella binzhouense TaxID=2555902 RepID=A0A964T3I6_9HYPH|nr:hypothetical protein [Propylenella binzhouense]MYZ47798.1 hypothetical protein [Propylenella binzhouense]
MIRIVQVLSVAAAVSAAVFVFQVKYRAEAVAERTAELERQLDSERETLSLLKAEWSYLIQPNRIQELVQRHGEQLGLKPLDPKQLVRIADLPFRPAGPKTEDKDALASLLEGATMTDKEALSALFDKPKDSLQ